MHMELSEPSRTQALHSFKYLVGTRFQLCDATSGQLRDLYFDDRSWEVRHLVSDPADRQSVRQLLIPPAQVRLSGRALQSELFFRGNRDVFLQQPSASSARPVCKQYALRNSKGAVADEASAGQKLDPHLRSCKTVQGYRLVGAGGMVGFLDDLLIDAETWSISYLVGRAETGGRTHMFRFSADTVASISLAAGALRLRNPERMVPPMSPLAGLVQAA